ncbi:hypothetical protein [Nonomuraea salmonea]|uniref:hypothetical protein n=1 Tax=Nonomuraea salmonea TaxID=46181 RepID=UPI0031EB2FE0
MSSEPPSAVKGDGAAKPLVDLRSAVVMLFAALIGLAAGVLAFLAAAPPPQAVLVGGGASAAPSSSSTASSAGRGRDGDAEAPATAPSV